MKQQALGLIETYGLVAAIEAADAALKTAAVELINYKKVTGGLITVAITGDVAAVQAAVTAGSNAAIKVGRLVSQHVIPRPLADFGLLIGGREGGPEPRGPKGGGRSPVSREENPPEAKPSVESHGSARDCATAPPGAPGSTAAEREYLESLSVVKLRDLARKTEGIAIQGRQISKANREQLLFEIMRAKKLM